MAAPRGSSGQVVRDGAPIEAPARHRPAVRAIAWAMPVASLLVMAGALWTSGVGGWWSTTLHVPLAVIYIGSAGLTALGWIAAMAVPCRWAGRVNVTLGLIALVSALLVFLG
ncbi:hypothetical protein [Brachybacterium hainanense]|uniref:Uncharacterized protein n=1 Tax=Brachybacterium hainanense TaxID=1541174 RepID=A0ABV6R773_9MICO